MGLGNNIESKFTNITAVICTKNEQFRIASAIESLIDAGISEIIIVDAHSADGTVEIAKKYPVKIIYDDGLGLGNARNLGIKETCTEFVLHFGADNTIDGPCIRKMMVDLTVAGCLGVSCLTKVHSKSYLTWCLNSYRQARYRPGRASTLGTPSMFKTQIMRRYMFDETLRGSDDSEFCDRLLSEEEGYLVVADAVAYEHGYESLGSVYARWKTIYGTSDYENFKRLNRKRSSFENLWSILYPLRNELVLPAISGGMLKLPALLPFLCFITFARYSGWITAMRKN